MIKIRNFQHTKNLRFLSMKKLLFVVLVIALLLMTGCAKQAEETPADTLDASVKEVDELDNELVDPELDSELDNINLDDW